VAAGTEGLRCEVGITRPHMGLSASARAVVEGARRAEVLGVRAPNPADECSAGAPGISMASVELGDADVTGELGRDESTEETGRSGGGQ